jgi:hypothetical protein
MVRGSGELSCPIIAMRRDLEKGGFTIEMLDALVRDGLATAEQRQMRAGRQPIKVVWLTITVIGRLALAG